MQPAPPIERCRGIASEGLRRIPVEGFKEERHQEKSSLTLQTTLPIHPCSRLERLTDLNLKVTPPPRAELPPDEMYHHWTDRRGATRLIVEAYSLLECRSLSPLTTRIVDPTHKGRTLSKTSEVRLAANMPPGRKPHTEITLRRCLS